MIEILKKIGFVLMIMSMFILLSCEDNRGKLVSKEDREEELENIKLDGTEDIKVTDIGINILKKSFDNKNIMISPVSIIEAMSMTENGASGNTLHEMENAFHMNIDTANKYFKSYNKAHTDKTLSIANSIWVKNSSDLRVKEDFIKKNQEYYQSEIYKEAFDNQTLQNINNWVSKKTDNMIDKIIDTINKEAIMYLINAVCFKADWENEYTENNVFDSEFTLENGKKKPVKMMYSKESVYLEDQNVKGMMKYYKDGKYAFVALLPNEDMMMKEYLKTLNGKTVKNLMNSKKEEQVIVHLPKFKSEYDTRLKKVLMDMGIKDAFNPSNADFSLLSNDLNDNIFIEDVIHKTFIEVDEKGTKAAAVTAVLLAGNAMPSEEEKKIIFDRPFIYMIYDLEFNIPVFIGIEMDI